MSRRSKEWNKGLSDEMKNMEFARQFIIASLEEGLSLQNSLGKAIRAYGVREFAVLAGISDSNIIRAIDVKHNPTQKTLCDMLKPFGLRLSAVAVDAA